MTYNDTFSDRAGRSADAKKKALELLKAKPKLSEAELAERKAARLAREQAIEDERAAKLAAIEAEKAAIEQAKADAEAARLEAKRQAEEQAAAKAAEKAAAAEAAKAKLAASFMLPAKGSESRYPARKGKK
jgi:hypothetical protein